MTGSTVLEAARSVADVVEANAAKAEETGELAAEVADALHAARLFSVLVPVELGGAGADIVGALEVFEELARQDGSTGWVAMAGATSTAFAATYTSDEAVRGLFGSGRTLMAGQLSPRGQAVREDGQFRVSGSYSFGSGAAHASHLQGGCLEIVDGAPVMRPNGMPEIRAVVVPRDAVQLVGNWDVMGLAGTSSVDYRIPEQLLDAGATFSIFDEEPRRGTAVHRLGVMTITAAGHAGFALGVARRALDEITALAQTKVRLGDVRLAEQQAFLVGLSRAEGKVRAARAFVFDAFANCQAAVDEGREQTPELRQLARLATTWGTEACAEAVEWSYRESGSDGLRSGSVLGRAFRDMYAGTQHLFVSRKTLVDAVTTVAGL
jgi:alkylation response protein AidB-like acyl-CoA dehydrogenase